MKIITFWVTKGGCGKSTLAVTMAHYLALKKSASVLLVDADDQCSISSCFDDPELPFSIVTSAPKDLSGYDYVIFDVRPASFTGNGKLVKSELEILANSNVVVSPFLPSKINYGSLMASFQLKFEGVLIPLMNRFKVGVKRHKEAFKNINGCLLIKENEAYGNAEEVGKTIFSKQKSTKGLSDARFAFTEVARKILKNLGE